MLPEMTLIEALAAIQMLREAEPLLRHQLIRDIVRYFFTNPAMIANCPFLHGHDCFIYRNRFFGCRAYGLWSQDYYDSIASHSRKAKQSLRQQWQDLGVTLPREVVDFQVPYCRDVTTDKDGTFTADKLLHAADAIERLSGQLSEWHQMFYREYFADLSFLITSLIFGVTTAVQIKFVVVRDLTTMGDRTRLDKVLVELPDIFAVPA